jgi:SAM-dependent methyltransferase
MALNSSIEIPEGAHVPGERPSHHSLHIVYSFLIPDLREQLATLEGRVIDIGCGLQPYRSFLGPRVTEYVGVDRAGRFAAPDLEGDALELPVPDASFDAAISTQVLEHVTDPQRALREAARVLKPGGILVLTCPGTWPDHETPHDYFRFTRYGLQHLLRNAGFECQLVKAQGGVWAAVGQLLNLELSHRAPPFRWLIPLVNRLALHLDAGPAKQQMALNWVVRAKRVKGSRLALSAGLEQSA